MDLTNLRESLESPVHPAPSRVHDERLTNEFRIAALQLTNLYKQGRKNAREAFMDGYSQAPVSYTHLTLPTIYSV